MVPNTREDLPEPETPVKTVSFCLVMSTLISLRLLSRADNADEFLVVHLAILSRNPGPPRGRPGVIRG